MDRYQAKGGRRVKGNSLLFPPSNSRMVERTSLFLAPVLATAAKKIPGCPIYEKQQGSRGRTHNTPKRWRFWGSFQSFRSRHQPQREREKGMVFPVFPSCVTIGEHCSVRGPNVPPFRSCSLSNLALRDEKFRRERYLASSLPRKESSPPPPLPDLTTADWNLRLSLQKATSEQSITLSPSSKSPKIEKEFLDRFFLPWCVKKRVECC